MMRPHYCLLVSQRNETGRQRNNKKKPPANLSCKPVPHIAHRVAHVLQRHSDQRTVGIRPLCAMERMRCDELQKATKERNDRVIPTLWNVDKQ